MNLLELFAGSRSVGKVGDELGFNVFSVDWQPFENIDLSVDIEYLTKEMIPFIPDVIWASPDCTTYSIAAISHHRNGTEPVSEYAKKCDLVNENLHRLIREYLAINPNLKYFIENPRGMMGKMPFVKDSQVATVWYCRYKDDRAKPTTIFTNHLRTIFNPNGWSPRPECFNGNLHCHHEQAPRGSKTGTQGRKDSYNRSKIPYELCLEILKSTIK
jgi:hypothetical protein